ncbi:MAG: class I SAM-dependent methyltransferase [Clostridia bacterium]|nr:class I SAM-dependent methyltransferase [Clostridia bacterium]
MFVSENWKDYEVLDTAAGEKLERWGNVILRRPDPQVIWKEPYDKSIWKRADGFYHRSRSGGGKWEFFKKLPDRWTISYKNLKFYVRPTGFKHTGLFPEQAVNWDYIMEKTSGRKNPKVLNLFAYTGGATLAAAAGGADVVHVDASKGMVSWAKENVALSSLSDRYVRFIVDDCEKFVKREIKRGHFYDGIIMDPPSYGRGPGGEMWKMEDKIYDLVKSTAPLLTDNPLFFIINSYTTGLQPTVIKNIITLALGCRAEADEIGLPVTSSGICLPCGATGRAIF